MRAGILYWIRVVFLGLIFIFSSGKLDAQTSAPAGIFQEPVYSTVKITRDIVFGSNFNHFFNANEILLLDTYEPEVLVDYRRPLIVYAHGGGFTSGDKGTDKAGTFGDYFAKRGYLVASINYRLAREDLSTTIDNYQGVYQATQDAKSAIRFFRRYADNYCVDTSAIFMIGTSAGASMCLTSAYWQQQEIDAVFNTDDFGPLDNSSGNEGYSSKLTGIVVCWGGMPDTAWLRSETVPNQIFHGINDLIIPYVSGFNSNGIYVYGGYSIHEASVRNGIESYLHPFVGEGHGVGQNSPQFDTLEQISNAFIFAHLPSRVGSRQCDSAIISPESLSFNFYPNPSDGHIFLDIPNLSSNYQASLSIYSITGQLVRNESLSLSPNTHNEFDYSSLATGIYFVKIDGESGSHVVKLMIHMP